MATVAAHGDGFFPAVYWVFHIEYGACLNSPLHLVFPNNYLSVTLCFGPSSGHQNLFLFLHL